MLSKKKFLNEKKPHKLNGRSLKMSWLHKLLDPFHHSPWKVLLLDSIQKWGGSNILYLSKEGLEKKKKKLTRFGKMFF